MGRSSHELANLGDIDVRSKPVADEAAGVPALQAVESVLESELDPLPSPPSQMPLVTGISPV